MGQLAPDDGGADGSGGGVHRVAERGTLSLPEAA